MATNSQRIPPNSLEQTPVTTCPAAPPWRGCRSTQVTLAAMNQSQEKPEPDDLAIDLVEAGHWLWEKHKFRPRYQLRSVLHTTVELLGDRYKQFNLSPDYLSGVENTLTAAALIERQRVTLLGVQILKSSTVSRWWPEPSKTARLCARSAIVSVLRHFTGSAVDKTSGLHGIHVAELGLGMDGMLSALDQAGNTDEFTDFAVSWSQDISDHRKFLMQGTG